MNDGRSLYYRLCLWADTTRIGGAIRDSRLLFPIVEMVHLLALTVLLGTIVVMALRMLGLTLRDQPLRELAGELMPWNTAALLTMIGSGALLFASEAMRCYGSLSFAVKMGLLFAALTCHVVLFRPAMQSRAERPGRGGQRAIAVAELLLWFGVGLAGRAIAFLP